MSGAKKIVALGYYGFGNLGDEAVLGGIRSAITSETSLSSASFTVLTADSASTKALHPGVETASRWKFREAADALRGTDLFVFGGGSLLQDATSARSVLWYALMASIARRRSRRVLWWAQGIGPLNSPLSRRVVASIGRRADAITVRDETSAKLLKAIGVSGSIGLVADPAFGLDPDFSFSASRSPHISPLTLLAFRRWKDDTALTVLSSPMLSKLSKVGAGEFAGLPMHIPDDLSLVSGVDDLNWRDANLSIGDVLGRVAGSSLVVAMRLHALIFAARCATPFVAVSYDPKVDALVSAAGMSDYCLPASSLTESSLTDAVARALADETSIRQRLASFASERRAAAKLPAKIAGEWFR